MVGSWGPSNSRTEMFLFDSEEWIDKEEYPLHNSISEYAALAIKRAVYIIGGWDSYSGYVATVAIFENEKWRKAGELNQARAGHGAITVNRRIYVIGGRVVSTTLWYYTVSFEL